METNRMNKGDTIKVDGINYVIEMISTPESEKAEGRHNLAKSMIETNRLYCGAVRKAKGEKFYWMNVYNNGQIRITKNSIC